MTICLMWPYFNVSDESHDRQVILYPPVILNIQDNNKGIIFLNCSALTLCYCNKGHKIVKCYFCSQVSLQSIELKSHQAVSVVIVSQLDSQLPVQSVQITTKVVSLNPTHGDKVCQWLAAGWWFSLGLPVSSSNKIDCHNITEILLKVALNTITQTSYITK